MPSDSLSSRHIGRNLATGMLDTVSILAGWPCLKPLPSNKMIKLCRGIKVWTDDSGSTIVRVEFSAPRVLFGDNGCLIEDQAQIVEALNSVRREISQIAHVPDFRDWSPWRLDLVWNYNLPATRYIKAHSHLRIKNIRSAATLWKGGQSISWRGARSKFIVTLYDKAAKARIAGSVLRAEVSLRGEHLRRHGLRDTAWWNWNALWSTYRTVLSGIEAVPMSPEKCDWPEAVGMEAPEIRERILARLAASKAPRTMRGIGKRVEAAAARLPEVFSWESFLPASGPPPAVAARKASFSRQ